MTTGPTLDLNKYNKSRVRSESPAESKTKIRARGHGLSLREREREREPTTSVTSYSINPPTCRRFLFVILHTHTDDTYETFWPERKLQQHSRRPHPPTGDPSDSSSKAMCLLRRIYHHQECGHGVQRVNGFYKQTPIRYMMYIIRVRATIPAGRPHSPLTPNLSPHTTALSFPPPPQ